VDKNDIVWLSENWAHNLTRFDPKTEQFRQFHFDTGDPLNSPGFSNFHMDAWGYVYETIKRGVVKIDSRSGKTVQHFPFTRLNSTYDNIVSADGRYWSGGQTGTGIVGLLDTKTGEMWELATRTPVSTPARGGFDLQGNAWFGGRGGSLIKLDPRTRRITEYYPPIPHVAFYEVMPDKNGEIWAAAMHSGRFFRFNPRTERWIDYMLPEPYSHNRRTWIDNATTPVTVWYVDHNGYMVRIQPLDYYRGFHFGVAFVLDASGGGDVPATASRLRTPETRLPSRYPSARASTRSCLAAESVGRNRTASGDPRVREHADRSRRGRLAPGEFRLRRAAACSAGRRSPAPLHHQASPTTRLSQPVLRIV